MITISFTLFFIVLFIVFYKVNSLPMTQIIPLWLFAILIPDLIFNSIIVNLQLIAVPKTIDSFLSYLLLQDVGFPIAILFLINIYKPLKPPLKAAAIIVGIFLLSMVERFVERLGVIQYRHWNIGFSSILWLSVIAISVAFYIFIDKFFLKGIKST